MVLNLLFWGQNPRVNIIRQGGFSEWKLQFLPLGIILWGSQTSKQLPEATGQNSLEICSTVSLIHRWPFKSISPFHQIYTDQGASINVHLKSVRGGLEDGEQAEAPAQLDKKGACSFGCLEVREGFWCSPRMCLLTRCFSCATVGIAAWISSLHFFQC